MREGVLGGDRLAVSLPVWLAVLLGVLAALLGIGSRAAAADSSAVAAPSVIGGPSSCPQPDAVWAELQTLLPRERLAARLRAVAAGAGPPVQIIDLGVPYRVLAAGRIREYRDETRDCAYRARIAAVFVALAIDPAEIWMEPPAPPDRPPLPAPPAPASAAWLRPAARLDLGVGGDAGVGSERLVAEAGLALRLGIGRRRFALVVGAVAPTPVDTSLGGVRLRQWRAPIDVGVRAQLGGRRLEPYGELGLCASWLSERALDLASPQARTSFEIGVRAAAGARLATHGRLAPFAALDAELVPRPPSVFALPQGVVGHTPYLWIGAMVGASLGL